MAAGRRIIEISPHQPGGMGMRGACLESGLVTLLTFHDAAPLKTSSERLTVTRGQARFKYESRAPMILRSQRPPGKVLSS